LRARFGTMPVNMISVGCVERLNLDLQDQPGKSNQTLTALRIILGWGMRLGYSRSNPAEVSKSQLPPRQRLVRQE